MSNRKSFYRQSRSQKTRIRCNYLDSKYLLWRSLTPLRKIRSAGDLSKTKKTMVGLLIYMFVLMILGMMKTIPPPPMWIPIFSLVAKPKSVTGYSIPNTNSLFINMITRLHNMCIYKEGHGVCIQALSDHWGVQRQRLGSRVMESRPLGSATDCLSLICNSIQNLKNHIHMITIHYTNHHIHNKMPYI